MRIDDDELLIIQERSWRVLRNNNASGTAKALAKDALRLTYVMQRGRKTFRARKAYQERQVELAEMWDYLESQFS